MRRMKATLSRQLGYELRLWAVILMIGFNGCAAVWQPVHGPIESFHWSLQPPEGWMRFATPTYEMLSKDGPYLQYIFIQDRPVATGFQHTQQRLATGMLPHEAARVIMDNLRGDPQVRGFSLLTNIPVRVGGLPGFKLVYTHQDRQGVDMQTIYYGVLNSAYFFNLRYTAAQRHYFAADLDTFERVYQSLHLSAADS